ncbi:cobalamin biosynthesis protein CobD/CbiB [Amycolatopsis echigonensis]|uniref:Cobalamin biosynthesis protein CobD n=1 Tax=Amycolatopsis echigonensis TaxID=2576905 RepID=A0A2N3WCT1_9PSEU|nr:MULTISPECIES: cobalamin biosynthesis protein [Amycolatopsis]MBB2501107.1 cobalamin biosynthesis protein [Amycolatopsis echigonensis]PKV91678.1 adenosylcobinamide-phosphate synthase [Amycolatopsis niigatensis]
MSAARAIGLILGLAADGALGDPRRRPPVTAFHRVVAATGSRRATGLGIAGAAVAAGVLAERAGRRSPVCQATATAVATWAVVGASGLATQGTELARDLEEGRLEPARDTLSELDPRVTDGLSTIGLSRASVETLAENTSEVVVTPLLWGAVAGVPGLLAARTVGLLRRLLPGHWVIDRLDELVHLLPTRVAAALTVLGAPVVGGSAGGAWRAWRRDTIAHPSPNAGRVEAAFAGALEIRVGGRTEYPQGVVELPVLGVGRNPDAGHVTRAVELSRVVGWLAAGTSVFVALLSGVRRRNP